jgi:mono/diheme cytochrome c family protein
MAKLITNYELRITNSGISSKLFLFLASYFLLLTLASCRQDMQDQPKYLPYRGSEIFADSLSSRNLVEGTVPRGYLREDSELYLGKSSKPVAKAAGDTSKAAPTNDVNEFPFPITREVLDRGEERYNIYCSPCHGILGDGKGMIANRGLNGPVNFHDERLRNAPLGHFFDVITNGLGRMQDYSMQIPPHERWAIIAYIRALQLSQNANVADVPADQMQNLK